MHLLPAHTRARIIHSIVADYRLRIPPIVMLSTGIGCLAIVFGLSQILFNGFSSLSLMMILLGIIFCIPLAVVISLFRNIQGFRFHIRDAMVLGVKWRGDEQVLDVGVGSGFTLFSCAKELKTGKAVGIDLFLEDSGGGTADIFWKNAKIEGVTDKVELKIANARDMPFEDNSFDVIVSTSAFHHMGGSESRQQVAAEIVRVLKPGGRVLVWDITPILQELKDTMEEAEFVNMRMDGNGSSMLRGDKPA